jgi:DNA end-binding protein Ku
MPRAIWKGAISFGLVNIPVELHTAVRENRPRFRLLHAKDESPVQYERVCQREGKAVAWEDLVKGYEYEKGQFVVLTKDDFKTAALEKSKTIDILDFVDPDQIDERYFETPYYLLPAKGAEHAYALLREAIRKSDRVGIAKVILRDAQHLAAVEAIEQALVLTMMRFADELTDISTFRFPAAADARGKELDLATALIENLASDWKPDKYTAEYAENLMRVIDAKLKGRKPRLKEPAEGPRGAEIVDLMSRLQKSLAAAKGSRRKPARAAADVQRSPRAPRSGRRRKTRAA